MHFPHQRPTMYPPLPQQSVQQQPDAMYHRNGSMPPMHQWPPMHNMRQAPFQPPMPGAFPRPFMHSFRTKEGTLDYNKIFSVIDQTVKVAQQISPLFSVFKKK
ncbi:YppG family protein [Fictibacillus iocasae]|uniref:YppG family protein n=1 Tax=Fictibacillus iocasae TaxID=2715437 RepID=A0ABW2NPQ0_9BACL